LSVRVVEHWQYEIGGGLTDPKHYDENSVLTLVTLLSDEKDLTGGVFRTLEADGTHLEHPMKRGDAICFVSHKYHNVTPVTRGSRTSLVIELWQGTNSEGGR
jgi:predicted 2-oxoglutarate/Fe(II)-dependent dioxygenase YbiX